jgi:hypothetical protein
MVVASKSREKIKATWTRECFPSEAQSVLFSSAEKGQEPPMACIPASNDTKSRVNVVPTLRFEELVDNFL